ncbi:MAG: hypothetical protein COC05_04065 [Gammaproteobacteria bacterium]|nr:oligosaccharide flippase family protein [bacterium AH-315-E07]PCH60596.1 MAG: hypothetical protein COC05_04065 [Gammaproteobacteria bacterium]
MVEIRTRRIKYSVATSAASKLVTIGAQLLAVPIAIKALGVSQYGVFIMLSAALTWVSMGNIGVGPGLIKGIAASVAKGDQLEESRYFTTALFLVTSIAILLLSILIITILLLPMGAVFGVQTSELAFEIQVGVILLGGVLSLQVILSVVEASRAGYQEQYVNNLWGIFGNTLSIILLLAVALYWPTIAGMIIAVYGTVVFAKLLNGVHLVTVKRPYLMPRFENFNISFIRILMSTGLAFLLVQISALVNQQSGVLLLGTMLGAESVVSYATMFRLVILAGGIVAMVSQPLLPAYIDAVARGDTKWALKAYRKSSFLLMTYAVVAGILFATFGQDIIRLWVGESIVPSLMVQKLFGLYFVLSMWAHINYIALFGMGVVWRSSIALLVESLLMVLIATWLIEDMGAAGAVAALCIANICISTWFLPLLLKQSMARFSQINETRKNLEEV